MFLGVQKGKKRKRRRKRKRGESDVTALVLASFITGQKWV
jgi:hypothetical protein